MPWRSASAGGFILALLLAAPAAAAGCDTSTGPVPPPRIAIVPLWGAVRYDNSRTTREITTLFASRAHAVDSTASAEQVARGVTASTFTYAIELELRARTEEDGRACVWPSGATLKIGFRDFTVYIARRYRPGSCAYGAVLAHEKGHIEIDRAALRRHLDELRRALELSLGRRFPLLADDLPGAKRAALRAVRGDMQPAFEALAAERRRGNAAHDSAESYRRTERECPDW